MFIGTPLSVKVLEHLHGGTQPVCEQETAGDVFCV